MRISDWSSDVCSSDLLWSPRFGILWDAASDIQFFANVSRSAEIASYDANIFATPSTNLAAQRATTYEIGTRGRGGGIGWDVALYRAEIRNGRQCHQTGAITESIGRASGRERGGK